MPGIQEVPVSNLAHQVTLGKSLALIIISYRMNALNPEAVEMLDIVIINKKHLIGFYFQVKGFIRD